MIHNLPLSICPIEIKNPAKATRGMWWLFGDQPMAGKSCYSPTTFKPVWPDSG
jgi:hypothetical protein